MVGVYADTGLGRAGRVKTSLAAWPSTQTHLCLGTETTVLHAGGKQLQGTLCKLEALLDHAGQLTDALGLLAHHVHGVGGADDHLRLDGGITDLHTSVPCVTQLAVEQLIHLGEKGEMGYGRVEKGGREGLGEAGTGGEGGGGEGWEGWGDTTKTSFAH